MHVDKGKQGWVEEGEAGVMRRQHRKIKVATKIEESEKNNTVRSSGSPSLNRKRGLRQGKYTQHMIKRLAFGGMTRTMVE